MELLPSEFIKYAKDAKVSLDKIAQIIGHDLIEFIPESESDLVSREVPINEEIPIRNWEILEDPTHVFRFKKIARRSLFQAYQLYYDKNSDYLTLVGTSRYNSVLFETYTSQSLFISDVSDKFEKFESVDQDLKSIQNLSSDEFFIVTSLLELFIEKYPTPNVDWVPDELLVFTKESLLQIIADSETKIEDQTWWQNWKNISDASEPNVDDIEMAMLLLANKGFIGILDEVDGKDVFFIGQSLLWLLRSLVWWDLGFIIENKDTKMQLFVLQASSLFAIVVENMQNFSLFNIDGDQLPKLVSNFMNYTESPNDTTGDIDQEERNNKLNFCSNCGSDVIPDSKFCAHCGNKLN